VAVQISLADEAAEAYPWYLAAPIRSSFKAGDEAINSYRVTAEYKGDTAAPRYVADHAQAIYSELKKWGIGDLGNGIA
jgi:hypothetical protein